MHKILVLYYSRHGSTRQLARQIALGVEQCEHSEAIIRTVADISSTADERAVAIPESGDIYVTKEDLQQCSGLIIGSPTRFGHLAAPLQYFFEQTTPEWLNGTLNGKPAGVFTSSASLHGGQESTLLSMMLPLLHHGMLMVGIPFAGTSLSDTQSGGTPYGASHVSGSGNETQLTQEEKQFAQTLGKRVANYASALADKN